MPQNLSILDLAEFFTSKSQQVQQLRNGKKKKKELTETTAPKKINIA